VVVEGPFCFKHRSSAARTHGLAIAGGLDAREAALAPVGDRRVSQGRARPSSLLKPALSVVSQGARPWSLLSDGRCRARTAPVFARTCAVAPLILGEAQEPSRLAALWEEEHHLVEQLEPLLHAHVEEADRELLGVQWLLRMAFLSGPVTSNCPGRRVADQIHHGLVGAQRSASPIHRDKREEAMFDLVPLAGARRKVADVDRDFELIGKPLELRFPHARPVAVAASASAVVYSNRDEGIVGSDIVNPIGNRLADSIARKVVNVDDLRLALWLPLAACVLNYVGPPGERAPGTC
jgi:hypothetical protein